MPHFPALDVAAMLLDLMLYFLISVGVVAVIGVALGVLFPEER